MHFWIDKGSYQAIKPYRAYENENIVRIQHHHNHRMPRVQMNRINNHMHQTEAQASMSNRNMANTLGDSTHNPFIIRRRQPHVRWEVLGCFIIFVCTIRFFILGKRSEVIIYCGAVFSIYLILLIYYGCFSQDQQSAQNSTVSRRIRSSNNSNNRESINNSSDSDTNDNGIEEVLPEQEMDIEIQIENNEINECSVNIEIAPPSYDCAIQLPNPNNEANSCEVLPPSYDDATKMNTNNNNTN